MNILRKTMLKQVICIISLLLIVLLLGYYLKAPILSFLYRNFEATTPSVHSAWETAPKSFTQGDFYVSKNGSDTNDGTKQSPFLTVNRALEAVEAADRSQKSEIIVCIEAGKYNIDTLSLSENAGGSEKCRVIYTSYGNDEVVLNAGTYINPSDFAKSKEYPDIHERLSETSRDNVYVVDLTKAPYDLEQNDWGNLYPIGTYNTANRYQGDTTGPMYSELFINGNRQVLARYPNNGYIYTDRVVSSGNTSSNRPYGDPAGDVYALNDELAARVSSWRNTENVWMFGFWQYDWADGSTPIGSFDSNTNYLTTKYQSFFGARENAPYYFYNCLEELDSNNEWYLDRSTGLLCVYSSVGLDGAEINLSLSKKPVITVNASFVTLNGITVTGTRGNGIVVNGNDNTISNCKISNIGGFAIRVFGSDNLITRNEIANTGMGGISASGGKRATLLPGNNVISNNLIHDWAQIHKTYQAGIDIDGVGNICANNELFNSPHLAIRYSGNNHIVEYNLIHDVCLESGDAGVIYAGRSWSSYGNNIRYNLIYDIGGNVYSPNGIYMDDALSGQNIYGNVLINIPGHAIFIGGGRDMNVYDNLIINSGSSAIRYDARAREGLIQKTWFSEDLHILWHTLYSSPWRTKIWQSAFPQYQAITDDISSINSPNFIANPSNSLISNNVIFDKCASAGEFDDAVLDFSTVSDNQTYYLFQLRTAYKGYKDGTYLIDTEAPFYKQVFNDVFEKAGRY